MAEKSPKRFSIVLKCCSMVIKTSTAQFAGGALDPDQSANISNPSIDCPSAACAQARLFKAEILIRAVHDAGTDMQEQTLLCLGCIAQLAMRSSEGLPGMGQMQRCLLPRPL